MRILFISFYYPPDIGPGSLRAKSIVDSLIRNGPSNIKIDVITTMPNRYYSFNVSAPEEEISSNVFVKRICLPRHKNGLFDQAKAFVLFSLKLLKLIKKKKWDIIIVTSSRLMTASLAALVAKQKNAKLYIDIRDLFVDTMNSILAKKFFYLLMPLLYWLEKWTFRSANKLNVVSAGFLGYLKKITPNLTPSVYTNGVDNFFIKNYSLSKNINAKTLILYTGNIGDGQGMHKIIPKAVREFKDMQFRLIGDGSARKLLINNPIIKSQNNIKILNPVPRSKLIIEYMNADILFLHLNNYKAFDKVLPSKIFEYAATNKPILAGVSGYAAKFLHENVKGVEIFDPCNLESMKVGLKKILIGPKIINRKNFCLRFSRIKIMNNLANDIFSLF